MPDSSWPTDWSSSRASSSGSSTSSASSLASRNTASAGATMARMRDLNSSSAELGLVDVDDVEERLGREQEQLPQRGGIEPGREHRGAAVEELAGLLRRLEHAVRGSCRCAPPSAGAGIALSRVCRSARISSVLIVSMSSSGDDPALDVHDVVVGEGAQHLADRVGLADVREELVAQAGALARALDDAGDVDERHRRRQDPLGAEDARRAPRGADRARRPRRCSARSSRTGSSRPARRSWSAR